MLGWLLNLGFAGGTAADVVVTSAVRFVADDRERRIMAGPRKRRFLAEERRRRFNVNKLN